MTVGTESSGDHEQWLERVLGDAEAKAIAAKSSREVDQVIEEYAEGKVKVFGETRRGGSRATRTEIETDSQGKVVIHKNPLQAKGMFAAAARFSEVEVIVGENVFSLRIQIEEGTSQFNPVYEFWDGEQRIGIGYGQRMDLAIAGGLLGGLLKIRTIPFASDEVTREVINWMREKLS